jgi:hypothetical protein
LLLATFLQHNSDQIFICQGPPRLQTAIMRLNIAINGMAFGLCLSIASAARASSCSNFPVRQTSPTEEAFLASLPVEPSRSTLNVTDKMLIKPGLRDCIGFPLLLDTTQACTWAQWESTFCNTTDLAMGSQTDPTNCHVHGSMYQYKVHAPSASSGSGDAPGPSSQPSNETPEDPHFAGNFAQNTCKYHGGSTEVMGQILRRPHIVLAGFEIPA